MKTPSAWKASVLTSVLTRLHTCYRKSLRGSFPTMAKSFFFLCGSLAGQLLQRPLKPPGCFCFEKKKKNQSLLNIWSGKTKSDLFSQNRLAARPSKTTFLMGVPASKSRHWRKRKLILY